MLARYDPNAINVRLSKQNVDSSSSHLQLIDSSVIVPLRPKHKTHMEIDKHPIQIQYQFIQETLIKIDSTAETKKHNVCTFI